MRRTTVTVFTNSKYHNRVRIKLKAEIQPALVCDPQILDLGDLDREAKTQNRLALSGYAVDELKIVGFNIVNSKVKARLDEDGKHVLISTLPGLKTGRLNVVINAVTDRHGMENVPVATVMGHVAGNISLSRGLVDFEKVEPGKPSKQSVTLTSKQPFKIENMKFKDPEFVTAEIVEVKPGLVYRIDLTAQKNFGNTKLNIYTNDPEQRKIKVLLFGRQ